MSDLKKMYREVKGDSLPPEMTITIGGQELKYRKRTWKISGEELGLRYGENPDQEAAVYELVSGNLTIAGCELLGEGRGLVSAIRDEDLIQSGKHPSMINMTDLDSGLNILRHLGSNSQPCAVIIKHNNPCGVALGGSLIEAFTRAYDADRIAAFGGCLVVNRAMDRTSAEAVSARYLEVVAAPEFEEGALDALRRRKDLRIVRIARLGRLEEMAGMRSLQMVSLSDGGLVLQVSQVNRVRTPADLKPAETTWKEKHYAIRRQPTEQEARDMLFGWAVEMGVTSNSVIYVRDGATVAIGTGEQDRVGVAEIATFKAYTKYADRLSVERLGVPMKQAEMEVAQGKRDGRELEAIREETRRTRAGLAGSVMVSDGFFPFRDSVDVAAREGISAIIQPGGSLRDYESIEACNEHGIAMVFTGQRSFKH